MIEPRIVPTVVVVAPGGDSMVINESDFDPRIHTLYEPPKARTKKKSESESSPSPSPELSPQQSTDPSIESPEDA